MVIFNSYVSLPEGISPRKMYKNQMEWSCWVIWKWSVKLWSAANAAKFKPVWIGVFREDKRRTELSTLRNSWVFHSDLVVLHVLNDHMYIHVLCVPVCTKYVCCSCRLTILLTIAFTYASILKTIQSISVSSLFHPPFISSRTEPWPLQKPRGCWLSFAETSKAKTESYWNGSP